MLDRMLTIAVSVVATLAVLQISRDVPDELTVDRLVVRRELIVSDTEQPWEAGFEEQQIPRGIYARSVGEGTAGLWVRSRLLKGEIDDPFDDRFHGANRDGSLMRAPGHISWNVWLAGAWRQMSIIQGEGMEFNEVPRHQWSADTHPGRLRFQTFRPGHGEPLTDVIIGQGMMSVGGGGYGGGGLPYPREVLQLWGGGQVSNSLPTPPAPEIVEHDASGRLNYALVAVGPQGTRSSPSAAVSAGGRAVLRWESVAGADSYIVLRDGEEVSSLLRIEGAEKHWKDRGMQVR